MEASEVINRAHYDAGERKFILERWQDCEDIIERNKAFKTAGKQTGAFREIANIPNVIIEQWLNEEWNRGNTALRLNSPEFDQIVARKLRDSDWAHLRTDK